jgi:hypothetical protein
MSRNRALPGSSVDPYDPNRYPGFLGIRCQCPGRPIVRIEYDWYFENAGQRFSICVKLEVQSNDYIVNHKKYD